MKIIGVRIGDNYSNIKNLRYGSIMIITDQDVNGSYIKDLIINFIHIFWPSLIRLNGFMKDIIISIIKDTKDNEVYSFYTLAEYKKWKKEYKYKVFKIKYYKGLGTSTSKEAKEYFSNIEHHGIDFDYNDEKDDESIDME